MARLALSTLLAGLVALAAACDDPAGEPAPPSADPGAADPGPAPADPTPVPRRDPPAAPWWEAGAAPPALACATGDAGESFPPTTWRFDLALAAPAARDAAPRWSLVASFEPMHPGPGWFGGPEPEVAPATVTGAAEGHATADAVQVVWEGGGVDLTRREGAPPGLWTGRVTFEDRTVEGVCWTPDLAFPYAYDPEAGACVDADGQWGWNAAVPIVLVRETGRGECAVFEDVMLNEDDLGYPVLAGWNLRGARLGGASLHFAALHDADLRGADLEDFAFGYAQVTGHADAFTRPEVEGGWIDWTR